MKRALGTLIIGSLVSWIVLAGPAWLLWGDRAIVQSLAAVIVCLIPAAGTLVWSQRAARISAEQQLLATFGGTGVRILVVIGAGIGLYFSVPALHHAGFLIWIVVFYLITLGFEVSILLKGQQKGPG